MSALHSDHIDDDSNIPKLDNELAVGFDPKFEKKWWRTERISWTVMLLFVIAGLCGFFGRGPWSRCQVSDPSAGMTVKYERVVRYKTPASIVVHFYPETGQQQQVLLSINNTIVQQLGEQRVVPQPAQSTLTKEGLLYTFPAYGSSQLQQVSFTLQPESVGLFSISLCIPGRPAFTRKVLALP
jgi:hypothetical protein